MMPPVTSASSGSPAAWSEEEAGPRVKRGVTR
jgi:hypothetical protein